MRHRVASNHFNRDTDHRVALLRNLVRSLVLHGELITTNPKAKEVKRWADKVIYRAKTDTVANRRTLHRFFGKRDVVNTLIDRVAPSMKDRNSGFVSLSRVGLRRGDNAQLVKLSLMAKPERLGSLKSGIVHAAPAKKAVAKKVEAKSQPASKAVSKKRETKKEA